MLKKLTKLLLYTRTDFSWACKQLGLDPETTDPALLDTVMCDSCGYWELPSKAVVTDDDTVYCSACYNLQTLRF